ncbi:MAG TPA: ATP-dependent helicase, partial [Candidatus Limnocylindrales bacterium]|nr:ATP-dependent helicase [Candidatus Limnocylindrales bacterium]
MHAFQEAYGKLNADQKQAVDTLDGPVLVIAGPGTGKTQLLSARVANILQKTDTPPGNILCLTFTESGAVNMRDRLTRFIGQAAYEVTIGTYHAFGGDLIKRYPEYFGALRLETPIDDLTKRQVISAIVDSMPYDNPLKQSRHHLGDLMSSLSEVKRALLTPDRLRAIAHENLSFIAQGSEQLQDTLQGFKAMPGYKKASPLFEQVLGRLEPLVPRQSGAEPFGALAQVAVQDLRSALSDAAALEKTTPLTVWKNRWLAKDADNHFVIAGELENRRLEALARTLEQYQAALAERGLYDFDDMILRAIEMLEQNPDLQYTLQERYLYILLDEFQDTNAAQLRLIQLLTDNPINEGRPNILAVGDDDQAIYAFQGAQYSNMLDFARMYQEVQVINLVENYRSHADILATAHNIAEQVEGRLTQHFPNMTKRLVAANPSLPPAHIDRVSFPSPIAERAWVAEQISRLIEQGTAPSEIAVLAPKHKYLESLVPYLNNKGVAVRYEKRENILEAPVVKQLATMSRLVLALAAGEDRLADALWAEVLSYDFWHIPIDVVWRTAWKVNDGKKDSLSWSKVLLETPELR